MIGTLLFLAAAAGAGTNPNPAITLSPMPGERWHVSYVLRKPARRLHFPITPDGTRVSEWKTSPGFKIVHDSSADYLQRVDGNAFRRVSATMPVHFSMPKKAYTPFSPFSDGGVLVYTGQFFACPGACGGKQAWGITLKVPPQMHSIVDGRYRAGPVSWSDGDEGKAFYVGPAKPIRTANLLAVVDNGLPADIRDSLTTALPRFIDNYAKHLGAPETQPMLFASYVEKYGSGFGSKGGSLPGEVFLGLYGNPAGKGIGEVPLMLTWHFAHEASHLFQQGAVASDDVAWIHEGTAEALADLSMSALGPEDAAYAERRVAKARQRCAKGLQAVTLDRATAAGRVDLHYPCGLIIQLAIDAAVKRAQSNSDGLYAVWRDYRRRVAEGEPVAEATYLAAVAKEAGAATARWVQKVTATKLADPDFILSHPA